MTLPHLLIDRYIDDVMSDRAVVGRLTKLTVERHIRDLHRTDIYFDTHAAAKAVKYMGLLPQSKGEFAGKNINVQPWQAFNRSVLYGWKRADGSRRFRTSFIEIGRKNGKSTEGAATGNYALTSDGEPGAEVYYAATKRDQALICFREAQSMCRKSKLYNVVKVFTNSITYKESFAKPLSSDENTMSGLNTHTAIIDEIHEHKTSGVIDLITTSIGARRQPLIYEITTAGKDKASICWDHHRLTENILIGSQSDDSWFGNIYTLDKDDDWKNRDVWMKSNPNLGISKKWEYMEDQFLKAKNMISYQNTFKQLDLNIWTDSHSRWLEDEIWVSRTNVMDMRGKLCYGGLDKASTRDFTAFTLCFPLDGRVYFEHYFWIPRATYEMRKMNATAEDLDFWVKSGWLKITEGNALDDNVVLEDILELNKKYMIKAIGYDRYKAETLASNLANTDIEVYEFGQGYGSMSEPLKEIETAYLKDKCSHDGSGVQRWMMGNVLIVSDDADNKKISKSKAIDKVDGPVSEVMAYGTFLKLSLEPDVEFISWKSQKKPSN